MPRLGSKPPQCSICYKEIPDGEAQVLTSMEVRGKTVIITGTKYRLFCGTGNVLCKTANAVLKETA